MDYIRYECRQQADGKWMVVYCEGLAERGIGWYGYNLTKEKAYKIAKDFNHGKETIVKAKD